MEWQEFSSSLLNEAVEELAKLPGIGKKTALRLALHLLKQPEENVEYFGNAIIKLRKDIKYCKSCNNISDSDLCSICSDKTRDQSSVCVVETIKDIIAIENTHQFRGLYYVLGGVISPMEGIGPADLKIDHLENKIKNNHVEELILALSTTMEGDTTSFYLYKKFKDHHVKITTIARGVSLGDELEFADELTLGRSIINRVMFESSLSG